MAFPFFSCKAGVSLFSAELKSTKNHPILNDKQGNLKLFSLFGFEFLVEVVFFAYWSGLWKLEYQLHVLYICSHKK